MGYNKNEYITSLKAQYGEFDKNFFIEENENCEIDTVVIINKGVTSIDSICKCPTIKNLILANNNIESLLPLYNLSTIIKLNVADNKLKSLFGIASNTQIQSLDVSYNQISECYSMQISKKLYEKEFANKPIEYISEYFTKPKNITLNGQEEIQKFIKQHSNENK